MLGYLEDQDTPRLKNKRKKREHYSTAKGKETMITHYQEYDGQIQDRLKKNFIKKK